MSSRDLAKITLELKSSEWARKGRRAGLREEVSCYDAVTKEISRDPLGPLKTRWPFRLFLN